MNKMNNKITQNTPCSTFPGKVRGVTGVRNKRKSKTSVTRAKKGDE